MTNKATLISFVLLVIILAAGFGAWYSTSHKSYSQIISYDQCAAAGYPILETYPEQCKLPDGRTFLREIGSATPPSPAPTSSPSGTAPVISRGILIGYIHVGPTCAVQPAPPIEGCDDRPYDSAPVTITNKSSGAASKAVADANGNFRITLTAGTYAIRVAPESGRFPSCETKDATILGGKTIAVDIGCDSGLR
jgi:hypothetical protein